MFDSDYGRKYLKDSEIFYAFAGCINDEIKKQIVINTFEAMCNNDLHNF